METTSNHALADFLEYGYYYVPQVFDSNIATLCREKLWEGLHLRGIFENDPSTWMKKCMMDDIFQMDSLPWRYPTDTSCSLIVNYFCYYDRVAAM